MDTQDTSPSVLLFFDKQRFIFNAGEVPMDFNFFTHYAHAMIFMVFNKELTCCVPCSNF